MSKIDRIKFMKAFKTDSLQIKLKNHILLFYFQKSVELSKRKFSTFCLSKRKHVVERERENATRSGLKAKVTPSPRER